MTNFKDHPSDRPHKVRDHPDKSTLSRDQTPKCDCKTQTPIPNTLITDYAKGLKTKQQQNVI